MAITKAAQRLQNAHRLQEIGLLVAVIGAAVLGLSGLLTLLRPTGRGPTLSLLVGGIVLAVGLGVQLIGLHMV